MGKYTRLEEIYPWQISMKCPVNLLRAATIQENETNKLFLQLKWHSNAEEVVQSVFVSLQPCDLSHKPLQQELIEVAYDDIACEPNENFGSKQLIKISFQVSRFIIQEVEIVFRNGETQAYTCFDFIDTGEPKLLLPKIPEKARPVIEKDPKYRCLPSVWKNSVSRCMCGALKIGDTPCPNCGLTTEQAFKAIRIEELKNKHDEIVRKEHIKSVNNNRDNVEEKRSLLPYIIIFLMTSLYELCHIWFKSNYPYYSIPEDYLLSRAKMGTIVAMLIFSVLIIVGILFAERSIRRQPWYKANKMIIFAIFFLTVLALGEVLLPYTHRVISRSSFIYVLFTRRPLNVLPYIYIHTVVVLKTITAVRILIKIIKKEPLHDLPMCLIGFVAVSPFGLLRTQFITSVAMYIKYNTQMLDT